MRTVGSILVHPENNNMAMKTKKQIEERIRSYRSVRSVPGMSKYLCALATIKIELLRWVLGEVDRPGTLEYPVGRTGGGGVNEFSA